MKKLLFGICTLTIMVSFGPTHRIKPLPPVGLTTLNGANYGDAQKMINLYKWDYTADVGLKSASAWFSQQQIANMYTVLKKQNGMVDGVRFYWGEATKSGTKLQLEIFLTTTKVKDPLPTPTPTDTPSIHGDYPDQDQLLSTGSSIVSTNQAAAVLKAGGQLYRKNRPIMGLLCRNTSLHQLDDKDTYNWVQRRHDVPDTRIPSRRDASAYNTESEWFDICFISSLFDAITQNGSNFDGLRVYLGEGYKDKKKNIRDVFILVPTHTVAKKHKDDFSCLTLLPTSLCSRLNPNPLHELSKPELFRRFKNKYLKKDNFMSGGLDNGELCQPNCQ